MRIGPVEVQPGLWSVFEHLGEGCSVGAVGQTSEEAIARLEAKRAEWPDMKAEMLAKRSAERAAP